MPQMAERRMFSKSIIDSDLFLNMPLTSQLLYFHLSMRADDDGFVDKPKSIMRLTGCKDDDLRVLISNGFVLPFEIGIVVIRHWRVHNYIQKDRYKPTLYKEEMGALSIDDNNVYRLDTECIQSVSEMDTQVRLGKSKDRLEIVESEGSSQPTPSNKKPAFHKYGEYRHIRLTDEQYSKLIEDFGENIISRYIRECDEYCQQHSKHYKDYNLTLRNWIRRDGVNSGSDKQLNEFTGKYSGTVI